MERINEFISLSISANPQLDHSYVETTHDTSSITLTFGLFANDCLFDLAEKSYEFQIGIARTYLEKYDEPLDIIIEKQAICCNTQSKLLEILQCKLQGIHRKLFLESNILFLIYQSQKNNLVFQLDCDRCAVLNKPVELEKIQRAKAYILDNLSGNLTIPIIASNVGTNQCYLKQGFKEVYDQTIFKFIQENRMIKARDLLQFSEATITEIAFAVGYASLSSFSQAFKNYFGSAPTDFPRQ